MPDQKNDNKAKAGGSSSSVGYIFAAALLILVVVVTGVVLSSIYSKNDPDDPVDPVTPVDPVIPEPTEFLTEGEFFFGPTYEDGSSDLANVAFIREVDDLKEYFDGESKTYDMAMDAADNFDFDEHDYLLVRAADHYCGGSIVAAGITEVKSGVANVVIEEEGSCGVCVLEYEYWLIEIDRYPSLYAANSSYNVVNSYSCDPYVSYKPIIYLYPEIETEVSVKLGAKEKLLVSYPKYVDGWKVLAQPDGKLTDLQTGRQLYSLYYEADNTVSGMHEEGFVVKGSDTVSFLEEKLAQLGLTETEAEEFIVYWLPQMQNNTYNYIYFAINDEVAANMPLEVSPAPTTSIRISMEWKALDAPISVKEQKLPETPTRKGFTLVEWGGTILK